MKTFDHYFILCIRIQFHIFLIIDILQLEIHLQKLGTHFWRLCVIKWVSIVSAITHLAREVTILFLVQYKRRSFLQVWPLIFVLECLWAFHWYEKWFLSRSAHDKLLFGKITKDHRGVSQQEWNAGWLFSNVSVHSKLAPAAIESLIVFNGRIVKQNQGNKINV